MLSARSVPLIAAVTRRRRRPSSVTELIIYVPHILWQAGPSRIQPEGNRQMKLTIVAATGGIGRHLVGQALAAGHDVTAVARRPEAVPAGAQAVRVDLAAGDAAEHL